MKIVDLSPEDIGQEFTCNCEACRISRARGHIQPFKLKYKYISSAEFIDTNGCRMVLSFSTHDFRYYEECQESFDIDI